MTMIRNITPQLAERGKIKIGNKGKTITTSRGNEFQPPQKLDHFVVTTLDRDNTGNFVRDTEAHALYGEKPTSLPVRLLFDDHEGNFASRYACFVGSKLWCAGDGVTAMRQNGAGPVKIECPCERIQMDYTGKDRCKFNGSLSVILDGMAGVGGVWKFRTTSYNSVTNIMSALAQIKLITGGPVAGIPLNLVLRPKQVVSPTDGKLQTVYVVSLEFPGSMEELQNIGMRRLRQQIEHRIEVRQLETHARKLLLPSPTSAVFDGETEDEIADEFYPPVDGAHDPETGEVTSAAQPEQHAAGETGGDAPVIASMQSAPAGQLLKQQLEDSIALEKQKKNWDTPALPEHINDPRFHSLIGEDGRTVDLFKKTPNGMCWKRTAVKEAVGPLFNDLDAAGTVAELEAVPLSKDNKLRLELCKLAVPIWLTEFNRRFDERIKAAKAEEANDPGRYSEHEGSKLLKQKRPTIQEDTQSMKEIRE